MRKLFIAGNWKMNKTIAEAKEFAAALNKADVHEEVDLAVIAPFTQIKTLSDALAEKPYMVGAQNVHQKIEGAYTGEISVDMLKEIKTECCIVGHSERREYFFETDETVNEKLKILLGKNIRPIMCVGENLDIRREGNAVKHIKSQLDKGLKDISFEEMSEITVAYEPIWAIGTGETATADQAEEVCCEIRNFVEEKYGAETAEKVIILYGGSVKPDNAEEILKKPDVDGALIGGASLDITKFLDIYNKAFFTKKY